MVAIIIVVVIVPPFGGLAFYALRTTRNVKIGIKVPGAKLSFEANDRVGAGHRRH